MVFSKVLVKLDGLVIYIINYVVKLFKFIIVENGYICNCFNNVNINLRIVYFVYCELFSCFIIL